MKVGEKTFIKNFNKSHFLRYFFGIFNITLVYLN